MEYKNYFDLQMKGQGNRPNSFKITIFLKHNNFNHKEQNVTFIFKITCYGKGANALKSHPIAHIVIDFDMCTHIVNEVESVTMTFKIKGQSHRAIGFLI